jgi:CheY-like chemotaxis protein
VIRSLKTLLVVDDDDAVRAVLEASLPAHLERFAVTTARNGSEAIDVLRTRPVDVLVTDVSMPVMDGFDLLAYVRNHHPNLPVVVMSVMAPDDVRVGAPSLGILRIVRKPTTPAEIARQVLEAQADVVKGRMSDVPLDTLLRLMKLERKSCSLFVRSGDEKGRLHFLSGDLVNAYAFSLDVEGDAAARHLLALDTVTIDFERSLHNHERKIHTPLETLLLEVATQRDEALRDRRRGDGVAATPAPTHGDTDGDAITEPAHGLGASAPRIDVAGALEQLQSSLADLRERTASTTRLMGAAAPEIDRAGEQVRAGVARSGAVVEDDRRVAEAWREVAAVAERLARTAEALASDPDVPTA